MGHGIRCWSWWHREKWVVYNLKKPADVILEHSLIWLLGLLSFTCSVPLTITFVPSYVHNWMLEIWSSFLVSFPIPLKWELQLNYRWLISQCWILFILGWKTFLNFCWFSTKSRNRLLRNANKQMYEGLQNKSELLNIRVLLRCSVKIFTCYIGRKNIIGV